MNQMTCSLPAAQAERVKASLAQWKAENKVQWLWNLDSRM